MGWFKVEMSNVLGSASQERETLGTALELVLAKCNIALTRNAKGEVGCRAGRLTRVKGAALSATQCAGCIIESLRRNP